MRENENILLLNSGDHINSDSNHYQSTEKQNNQNPITIQDQPNERNKLLISKPKLNSNPNIKFKSLNKVQKQNFRFLSSSADISGLGGEVKWVPVESLDKYSRAEILMWSKWSQGLLVYSFIENVMQFFWLDTVREGKVLGQKRHWGDNHWHNSGLINLSLSPLCWFVYILGV